MSSEQVEDLEKELENTLANLDTSPLDAEPLMPLYFMLFASPILEHIYKEIMDKEHSLNEFRIKPSSTTRSDLEYVSPNQLKQKLRKLSKEEQRLRQRLIRHCEHYQAICQASSSSESTDPLHLEDKSLEALKQEMQRLMKLALEARHKSVLERANRIIKHHADEIPGRNMKALKAKQTQLQRLEKYSEEDLAKKLMELEDILLNVEEDVQKARRSQEHSKWLDKFADLLENMKQSAVDNEDTLLFKRVAQYSQQVANASPEDFPEMYERMNEVLNCVRSQEMAIIREQIQRLEQQSTSAFSVGNQRKANAIRKALRNIPLENRAKAFQNSPEVQKALASHRSFFKGSHSQGHVDMKKAAASFRQVKEAVDKLSSTKGGS